MTAPLECYMVMAKDGDIPAQGYATAIVVYGVYRTHEAAMLRAKAVAEHHAAGCVVFYCAVEAVVRAVENP